MLKRIIASVLIVLALSCTIAAALSPEAGIAAPASYTAITSVARATALVADDIPAVEENIEDVLIEKITSFEDLNTYTLKELEALIEENKQIQVHAHELAEHARALGWAEDGVVIENARTTWHNSQVKIEYYKTQYEASEEAIWGVKMEEYPAATTIWRYMKDLGWNDYVCAGIMGNLMAEVGGQTLDIQYWLYGDSYYGMCQWNHAYRSEIWGADLEDQLDFLRDTIKYEIDTFGFCYQSNFNYDSFLLLDDEQAAAKAFAKCYERCGSGSYSIRQKNATIAYEYFVS